MTEVAQYRVELTDRPEPQLRASILKQLVKLNEVKAGQRAAAAVVTALLHDANGEIVGGLWAEMRWRWLTIETLFLPESLRGQGIGRQLMADVEREARRQNCIGSFTQTYSFQARGFYERLGYVVVGEVADYPPGHRLFFLSNRFG